MLRVKALEFQTVLPEVAESFAVYHAVLMAIHEGWRMICCESNAKIAINKFNNHSSKVHWQAENFFCSVVDISCAYNSISFC